MISLAGLRPNRLPSECDLVSLHHLTCMHQFHRAGALVDDNAVGVRLSVELRHEGSAIRATVVARWAYRHAAKRDFRRDIESGG